MENLHAPTVMSGPTSGPGNDTPPAQLSIFDLDNKKRNMEDELRSLSRVLDSHGVTMDTSLTTPDGFPRADIDVAQIRTIRSRIVHLKNDYKELMATLEQRMEEHFASLPTTSNLPENASSAEQNKPGSDQINGRAHEPPSTNQPDGRPLSTPFAKVNTVAASSPAEQAGLKPGDLIRNFGYVHIENHNELRRVAECVQGNENRDILVRIVRTENGRQLEKELHLTPHSNWGGRGLLGCHILPYS